MSSQIKVGHTKLFKAVSLALILTSFVAATYGFGFYLFSVIVSDIRADLGFNYSTVGLITASGQIGFLLFSFLGSLATPILGGSQVVLGSALLCGICLTALSSASNVWQVATLLTILGGCAASVYVPMVELVGRVVDFQNRGKVLGLISSGTSYGVFINGLTVPFFVTHLNWRYLWLFVGCLTLLAVVISFFAFSKLGLFKSLYEGGSKDNSGKAESLWKASLSEATLLIWILTFLNGFSLMPFQNYLAPYLREELNFSVSTTSQVWTLIGFIGMGAGFLIGALSDRIGIQRSLFLSYVFILVAAMILNIAPNSWSVLISGFCFAMAFYPIFGLIPAYLSKSSEIRNPTLVFGVANITLGLGGMLGNFLGGRSITLTGTFIWIYIAVSSVALISLFLVSFLQDERSFKHHVRS